MERFSPAMRLSVAPSAGAISTVAPARILPTALSLGYLRPIVPLTQSLPLENTQSGNVFKDRNDASVAWYLPAFVQADDIDTAFGFAATQSGVDSQGDPFFHATLTFGLRKIKPDDAKAYAAANPSVDVREIPLEAPAATLTTTSSDPKTGQPTPSVYLGQVTSNGDQYTLTFTALLGVGVIVAYENLRNGGATIALSASYAVWREQGDQPIWTVHPVFHRQFEPMVMTRPLPRPEPPQPQPTYVQATAAFSVTLPLATKYANVGYATAYTVSDGTTTHAILSVDDLQNFRTDQSEFSEFTALGDISQKYPSFSSLYIGALSRTIVAVPAQYGIERGSAGTAAVCQALLDSTAGSTDGCKFEFSFVLAPVVSQIDLVELANDVGANSASHDCTVVLPSQLDSTRPGTLATSFASSVTYLAGTQPHTFALSVDISDAGANSPAVANANLFIKQLTSQIGGPSLVGQFAIKLDDFYPQPVEAPVAVNFGVTGGSDDIGFSIDSVSQVVDLINNSPLDLAVSRYAVAGDPMTVTPLAQTLLAKQSFALPGVAASAAPAVLVDRTLALEQPLTKAATARYLAFNVQDVQAVQYELGVLAAGVSFAARGIASIKVQIALDDLPQISVPAFTLTPLDQSGNQQIALPIQYALTTLSATVSFTVAPANAQQSQEQFTLTNDFIDQPVLVLGDANIPGFPAAPPPASPSP